MLRNLKRYFSNNFFFFYKQDKSPTQRYPFSNKIQSTKKNLEISHADNSSSKKEKKKTIIQTENTEVARYHTLLFLQRNEVFTWCTPFFVHTPCEIKIYDRAKHDYDDKSSRRESRSSADVYSRAEKVGRFGDVSTRRGI